MYAKYSLLRIKRDCKMVEPDAYAKIDTFYCFKKVDITQFLWGRDLGASPPMESAPMLLVSGEAP